jgi:hypothetical protein
MVERLRFRQAWEKVLGNDLNGASPIVAESPHLPDGSNTSGPSEP